MNKLVLFFLFVLLNNYLVCQVDSTPSSIKAITTKQSILSQTYTPSVFSGHNLIPSHKNPIYVNSSLLYWPSIILFIVFAFYISIKVSDPKKILKIFISVFSLQASKQLIREDYKLYKRVSLLLSLNFILVISLLLFITNNYFGLILKSSSPIIQYLFFILVTIGVYFAKVLSVLGFSFITSRGETGKEYIFNIFVFCQITGLASFPFIVFLQFSKYPQEWFLYPTLIVCGCFYCFRMFRGIVISTLEQNVGILYIILYFCALEILPFLVLVKFLLTNF